MVSTRKTNFADATRNLCRDARPSVSQDVIARGFTAALREAAAQIGATSPNPPVGCALLDNKGQILVVAAHMMAGESHAEQRALEMAHQAGVFDRIDTAIITLEPCAHHGRTPPCADALLSSPVRHVWIGAHDPNPAAQGGAERLRQSPNGVHVFFIDEITELAPQAALCADLIAPFTSVKRQKRSFVTVKQALDPVGSMRPPPGQSTFTSPDSLVLAHRLRRATDAIITGAGTILSDRPAFKVRHVADHPGRAPRILVICDRRGVITSDIRRHYDQSGFETWISSDITALPARLAERGVLWALLEAGPRLVTECDSRHLWNDWLTIQTVPGAEDDLSIRAEGPSPLHLLPPFFDMPPLA